MYFISVWYGTGYMEEIGYRLKSNGHLNVLDTLAPLRENIECFGGGVCE